jgi:hypothetical protein
MDGLPASSRDTIDLDRGIFDLTDQPAQTGQHLAEGVRQGVRAFDLAGEFSSRDVLCTVRQALLLGEDGLQLALGGIVYFWRGFGRFGFGSGWFRGSEVVGKAAQGSSEQQAHI